MLTHQQVWEALDKLAARQGLSPSALAKRAGLDATAFNKSKRISSDGLARPRWPSTESLSKVLEATGATLEDFAALAAGARAKLAKGTGLPIVSLKRAAEPSAFGPEGLPNTPYEDEEPFSYPLHGWALLITGNRYAPVYRNGDRLIVDPHAALNTGDRVVLKTNEGQVHVMALDDMDQDQIDLSPLNPLADPLHIKTSDVAFMARVMWVSQ